MYIQITEKCNMTCAHCCFAATTKGDNMDHHTFISALQVASRYGDYITLGGGEPTIHKEFFTYLDKAIELYNAGMFELPPLVITNGKLKTKAHKLLDYVEDEKPLFVELSQDEWHDPIDPLVISRFRSHQKQRDRSRFGGFIRDDGGAGIRTVDSIVAVGRAADAARGIVTSPHNKCCCEDVLCDPNGVLWSCGCKHTRIGTIWDTGVLDDYDREYAHQGGKEPNDDDMPSSRTFPILEIRA